LSFKIIAVSPMVALVPVRHRLARRKSVSLATLAAEPFVFLAQADEPQINLMFRRRCLAAGFDLNVVVEVQHTDALFSFVAAGFGVSCAPEFICRLNHPDVAHVELEPNFQSGIIAVWHPERVSATGRRFLETLPDVS
jgi:DNA-binding transcriptional LysR family regulator